MARQTKHGFGRNSTKALQTRTARLVREVWGSHALESTQERALRCLEEALELAQAADISYLRVGNLAAHIYSRPPGELRQELAGLGVTALAMAENLDANLGHLIERELGRIATTDIATLRRKHHLKVEAGLTVPEEQGVA